MGIREAVSAGVADIVATSLDIRRGRTVPTSDSIAGTEAVRLDATYLYADLVDSSFAAHRLEAEVTATLIRSYLYATTRILRHFGGEIRGFDGDRVMAIFIGEERENTAVRAALAASWAVEKEVRPQLEAAFPSIKEHTHVRGVVGVDSGEALLINGGIRGKNDMVSIGQAPNVAAKLSALRGNSKSTIVTGRVYAALHTDQKSTSAGTLMWEKLDTAYVGGKPYNSYGCGYFRPPS